MDFRHLPVALLILDGGCLSLCRKKEFNAMVFSEALISIHGNWVFGCECSDDCKAWFFSGSQTFSNTTPTRLDLQPSTTQAISFSPQCSPGKCTLKIRLQHIFVYFLLMHSKKSYHCQWCDWGMVCKTWTFQRVESSHRKNNNQPTVFSKTACVE